VGDDLCSSLFLVDMKRKFCFYWSIPIFISFVFVCRSHRFFVIFDIGAFIPIISFVFCVAVKDL
jgi:hypothetical protein